MVERLTQRHGQFLDLLAGLNGLVDVALFGFTRIEAVVEPVIHRCQQRRAHEVRVYHRVDRAIFKPARRGDPQTRGAVLEAPIGEDRRPEARIPETAIGVDGRGTNGRERLQVMDHAADGLEPFGARHLRVVIIGHERILAAFHIHVVVFHARQVVGVVTDFHELVLTPAPERHIVVTAGGRHAHEGLGHEAGEDTVFPRDLRTDLAVCCQTVGIAQHVIEHPVQFELTRRILVVPLDHVEAHLAGIADHLHGHRAQAFELVDVVAIGFGVARARLAVFVEFQPHHFRLGANAQLGAVLGGEVFVQAAQVAAAIRCQVRTRIYFFFAVAEERAKETPNLRCPGQLHEGFRLRDADKLGGLRSVAQVIARTGGEQVHGGAVDQLEAFLSHSFPMVGRNAFAHDLTGDRNELQVKIFDPQLIDLRTYLLDLFVPALGLYKLFNVHGHVLFPAVPMRAL